MNLTLTADDEVIRRARLAAQKQGRSLNDWMREQIERLAGTHAGGDVAAEFLELAANAGIRSGEPFRRGDAYDAGRS